jgi:hypothetical protein
MKKNTILVGLIALFLTLRTEGSAQTYGLQVLNGAKMYVQSGTTLKVVNNLGTKVDGIGSVVTNNGSLAMEGSFLIQNNGSVQTSTGQAGMYKIGGSFTNLGTGTFNPVGTTVDLYNDQTGTVSSNVPFYNVTVNRTLSLTSDMMINGDLTFATNGAFIQANNFNVSTVGTITGAGPTKFVITNGSGTLEQYGSTTAKLYPVGTSSTSYTPLSITDAGTLSFLRVNVKNGVSTNPNVGTSANFTTGVVNKSWTVSQTGTAVHNLTLTPQWTATDELSGFNRALCSVTQWNSASAIWNLPGSTVGPSTTNNFIYTRTRSGLTTLTTFAVGSSNAILPLTLVDFTGKIDNQNAFLEWTTSEEHNMSHFDIEKSVNGKNFLKIAEIKAKNTPSVYSAIDDKFFNSSYYRLKINELDGTVNYSKIVFLEKNSEKNLKIISDRGGAVLIETNDKIELITVTNSIGQLIKSTKEKRFLINELNAGIYIVSVKTDKGFLSKKIFKD